MKFRMILRIAITTSVILLCIGIAISLYVRMSTAEKTHNFNLYTLVPASAVTIVDTDDMIDFVHHINKLNCSKDGNFLYISELFTHLKDHINTVLDDSPHGLSHQMNKMLVSFHEPDNVMNQVFYCRLGVGDYELVEKFIKKYCASTFPSKYFDYHGEEIRIYAMPDDTFLSCYITSDFLAVSYQKRLIEEVIDARLSENSILSDSVFSRIRSEKKANKETVVYVKMEQLNTGRKGTDNSLTTSIANWTEFSMKMDGDAIYFSGIHYGENSDNTFMDVLRKQRDITGFPGTVLPSATYFFHKMSISDLSDLYMFTSAQEYARNPPSQHTASNDREFFYFLQEFAGETLTGAQFIEDSTEDNPCVVLRIPLKNAANAEKSLSRLITLSHGSGNFNLPEDSVMYVSSERYSIKAIPYNTLFNQLAGISAASESLFACFYNEELLISPDAFSIAAYINALEKQDVLENSPMYQEGVASLSNSFNFLLMADMEKVFEQPENFVKLIPNFFFRHEKFFRHFTLTTQFTAVDNVLYPNIVLLYKGKHN